MSLVSDLEQVINAYDWEPPDSVVQLLEDLKKGKEAIRVQPPPKLIYAVGILNRKGRIGFRQIEDALKDAERQLNSVGAGSAVVIEKEIQP